MKMQHITEIDALKAKIAGGSPREVITLKTELQLMVEQRETLWKEIDALKAENERLRKDAERYQGIRQLLGYVQDGSSTTVEIFQDDATSTFHLRLDDKSYVYADCFGTLIDLAMGKAKPAPVSKQAQEIIDGQRQMHVITEAYYKDHPEERPVCGGPEDFGEND